ncbi:MAG: 3-phosphoshikimate 1-carboxyvinyltransferase [Alistipes sp.]|nr:3-phosphoshikimate 1-carboxyvinyltransferase [Alistipes sp.]
MDKTISAGRLQGSVLPPCSKSYAQRALAVALLANGKSVLRNMDFCNDTLSALNCIKMLGAKAERTDEHTIVVEGGLKPQGNLLSVGESGLSARLFTPIASLCSEPIVISGEGTLLYRPMDMMIQPLRALGVDVRDGGGRLPIEVCGPIAGGEIVVDGSVSSQFITGLLLALPLAEQDTVINVSKAVSKPYLDMTIDIASHFGVAIEHNDYEQFYVAGGQCYTPTTYSIEGDWSAAAMLLVAGAVAGEVTVGNISMLSKQADVAICRALVAAGAELTSEHDTITAAHRPLHGFEFDATNCPDLFPALATLAAAAEGESRIKGTHRLEHKESNRAEAIRTEFGRLGIEVDLSEDDIMIIRGGAIRGGVEVDSHGDHRMAMTLAVAGLISERGVTITGAECVAKSYPEFFETIEGLLYAQ